MNHVLSRFGVRVVCNDDYEDTCTCVARLAQFKNKVIFGLLLI